MSIGAKASGLAWLFVTVLFCVFAGCLAGQGRGHDGTVATDIISENGSDAGGDAKDSVSADELTSDAGDIGHTPGPDMMEEVCGPVATDSEHVEGQPCQTEGESYCVDTGRYPRLFAVIRWQCIRPGMITCARNPDDSLTWKSSNCENVLAPMAGQCLLVQASVPCLQYDNHAVCCPNVAYSPVAGYGFTCELADIGKVSCSPDGQKSVSAIVYKCGFQDEIASEQDSWFRGQEYPRMECASIYAECPYWYGYDYCGRDIKGCDNNEGCTRIDGEDGYRYFSCPGVCFYDGGQDVNRCTTTCEELDAFYADN